MAKKAKDVAPQQDAAVTTPDAPFLVLGAKAPKHRAGHNATAWTAITAILPATAAQLAALPDVQACGGAKKNGLLFVGYAQRRGWLAVQAPVADAQQ